MISYLVAVDQNGLIGKDNDLPWHLPADLKYFKETTMGKTIVMGRKTFESIGKPLPGRHTVILTRDPDYQVEGCTIVHSPEEVIQSKIKDQELFVIGGSAVFKAFEPYVKRLYLTQIDESFEGDTYFTLDYSGWKEISSREGTLDEKNSYPHRFLVMERP